MLPDVLTPGQLSLGLDRHDLLDACGLGKSTVHAYRPHGQGAVVSSTNSEAASAND
jgi:hypothetical protein